MKSTACGGGKNTSIKGYVICKIIYAPIELFARVEKYKDIGYIRLNRKIE